MENSDEKVGLDLIYWNKNCNTIHLNKEERLALLREYRKYGEPAVREKLIYGSIGLVLAFVSHNYEEFGRKLDRINPDFEDIFQTGLEVLCGAVDSFDPDAYNFEFSTYLYHRIDWKLRRDVFHHKSIIPFVSTDDKIDDDGRFLGEILPDSNFDIEQLIQSMDMSYLKEKVIPFLSSQEKRIFEYYFFDELPYSEIGKIFGFSQERVRQQLDSAIKKVTKIFQEGPTEIDKITRGVQLRKSAIERIEKNQKLFEKYGRAFLKQHFRPLLTPTQKDVFDSFFLNYRGQEVARMLSTVKDIEKKLDKKGPELLKKKENGELAVKKPTLRQQQCKNRIERLLNQYGGRLFLQKYFVPTLEPTTKKVFEKGLLEYDFDSLKEMAKQTGLSPTKFKDILMESVEQLKNTDFETIVRVVDFKNSFWGTRNIDEKIDTELIRQKFELVKKFGGEIVLRKYFCPMLSEDEKKVFDCLYLRQNFTSYENASKILGKTVGEIISTEKVVLSKLENTNLEELKEIEKKANLYISKAFSTSTSHDKNKMRRKIICNYGGIQFLRERFIPTIYAKIDKEIFEKYILHGVLSDELKHLFNNGFAKRTNKDGYVKEISVSGKIGFRIKNYILPQLEKFKASFENFEQTVKEFYMKKGFETVHSEDFEKLTFDEIAEKTDEKNKKQFEIFSPELIQRAGGEKEVLRNFRPTLNSVTKQLILFKSLTEKISDIQIAKELGLTSDEFNESKEEIADKLQNYVEKKEKKEGKSK